MIDVILICPCDVCPKKEEKLKKKKTKTEKKRYFEKGVSIAFSPLIERR